MFRKDEQQVYRCIPLENIAWLEHGFGTRHSPAWPPDEWPVISLRQIHSNQAILVTEKETGRAGEADALVTAWRGTAADIAGKVVEELRAEFGVNPPDLLVAIGPGIGPCCYEVGPEVAARFQRYLPGQTASSGRVMLDLAGVNRRQLEAAGVRAENIFAGAPCTCCHPGDFHSYRRSPGEKGRMVSAIGIQP